MARATARLNGWAAARAMATAAISGLRILPAAAALAEPRVAAAAVAPASAGLAAGAEPLADLGREVVTTPVALVIGPVFGPPTSVLALVEAAAFPSAAGRTGPAATFGVVGWPGATGWVTIASRRPLSVGIVSVPGACRPVKTDCVATIRAAGLPLGCPFGGHHCQVLRPSSSSRASAASARRRVRLRSWGAATGGGSCARIVAHSGAGGSWPKSVRRSRRAS